MLFFSTKTTLLKHQKNTYFNNCFSLKKKRHAFRSRVSRAWVSMSVAARPTPGGSRAGEPQCLYLFDGFHVFYHWFSWVFMGFHRFSCFFCFHWFLSSFHRFHWFSQVFMGYYYCYLFPRVFIVLDFSWVGPSSAICSSFEVTKSRRRCVVLEEIAVAVCWLMVFLVWLWVKT